MEGQVNYNGVLKSKNVYYKHSGKFECLGIFLMLLFGILSAIIFAGIYATAIIYIPLVFINIFITFFYGTFIGKLVGYGAKIGKVRNTKIVIAFAVLIGIFAEYTNWVWWIMVYTRKEIGEFILLLNPSDIFAAMSKLSETGVWSIKGDTPTGIALYIVWICEAVFIICTAVAAAREVIKDKAFCEDCNCWVKGALGVSNLEPLNNLYQIKSEIEAANFECIKGLNTVDSNLNHTIIMLKYCDQCKNYFLIDVSSVIYIINNKQKKPQKKVIECVKNFIIDRNTFEDSKNSYGI